MVRGGKVFTAFFRDEAFQIALNGCFILAVGDELVVHFAEDALQCFRIVYQHIPRGGAHEDFDSGHIALGDLLKFLQVVVGGTHIEAVISPRNRGSAGVFLF